MYIIEDYKRNKNKITKNLLEGLEHLLDEDSYTKALGHNVSWLNADDKTEAKKLMRNLNCSDKALYRRVAEKLGIVKIIHE